MLEILCIAVYLALAFWCWPGGACGPRDNALYRLLPLIPLLPHLALLHRDMLADDGIHLGFGLALSAMSALTVLIYATAAWRYRIGGVIGIVLAFAGFSVLLQALMPAGAPIPHTNAPLFRPHLLVAFTATSLFTIAALHALLIAVAEKHLHKAVPPRMLAGLPPLLTLEKLLFRMLQAGFALLTLTVVSGMGFSEEVFGRPFTLNHKTVFGLLAWLIFGALLLGRRVYGWRGRTAILWTLAGFASLILAYAGVKFVLEVLLGRTG